MVQEPLLLIGLGNRQPLGREPHPPVHPSEHVHQPVFVRAVEVDGLDVLRHVAIAVGPRGTALSREQDALGKVEGEKRRPIPLRPSGG